MSLLLLLINLMHPCWIKLLIKMVMTIYCVYYANMNKYIWLQYIFVFCIIFLYIWIYIYTIVDIIHYYDTTINTLLSIKYYVELILVGRVCPSTLMWLIWLWWWWLLLFINWLLLLVVVVILILLYLFVLIYYNN